MNIYQAELYHHGIKGQRWGVRRYQNPDGSLTAKGLKRYKQGRLKLEKGYAVTSDGKVRYETDRSGALTKAGAKAWYKNDPESGDMMSDELDYQSDYDKTPNGKNNLPNTINKLTRCMMILIGMMIEKPKKHLTRPKRVIYVALKNMPQKKTN